ncbi:hypothetical protein ASG90_05620 [Nocardioides sp. Soil797]|nr:hypothetical protein ASG90_05620 [Nocardioides sp. Soil797]
MDDATLVAVSLSERSALVRGLLTLVAGVGVAVAVIGALVWISGDLSAGARMVAIGAVTSGLGLALRLLQRRAEQQELRVSCSGLRLTSFGRTRSWQWDEIREIHVTGVGRRFLVVEDESVALQGERHPRADGFLRATTASGVAVERFSLVGLDHDEATILDAIRSTSGGRFPTAGG